MNEPWRKEEDGEVKTIGIFWQNLRAITDYTGMPVAVARHEAQRERVIACVNACAGIPTEVLQRCRAHITMTDGNLILHCSVENAPQFLSKTLKAWQEAKTCTAPSALSADPGTTASST